jgi:hypothetical protein
MTMRIDPQTGAKVSLILKACRERGVDPVATLDRAGYLMYPARRRQDQQALLRLVHATISAMTPTELGGGQIPGTAADMKRCILETIERMSL